MNVTLRDKPTSRGPLVSPGESGSGGRGSMAEWENAGKAYLGPRAGAPAVWAVRGINLRIGPGEAVGVVGPNRAGKTTLVKLLLSLCRPSEGRVRRFGSAASDRRTLGRVGYVPDDPAFSPDRTARGVLAYHGALALLEPDVVRRRSDELLERVGLADRSREPIGRFSKGMLQRLALAQALLNEPDLLVLDEPAEGLDLAGRALLASVVTAQRARDGAALLISHAPSEVERLCDRLAVLVGGRLVFDGPLAALPRDAAAGPSPPLESLLARLYERESAAATATSPPAEPHRPR